MLLAVDIGNSRVKTAVFENTSLIEYFVFEKADAEKYFQKIFQKHPKITDVIQSSVANELFFDLPNHVLQHKIDHHWDFPFQNEYETPATLGIDRMVLAAGAVLKYPSQNRLVIDAGTCITYDICNQNDVYLGGAISPGLKLRYDALHNFTAKLPLLTVSDPASAIGSSTAGSIHSGVVNGVVHEINGFIAQYAEKHSNFIIILTGGDTDFLADRVKYTIFANSNFLLESLNHIFQYKFKND